MWLLSYKLSYRHATCTVEAFNRDLGWVDIQWHWPTFARSQGSQKLIGGGIKGFASCIFKMWLTEWSRNFPSVSKMGQFGWLSDQEIFGYEFEYQYLELCINDIRAIHYRDPVFSQPVHIRLSALDCPRHNCIQKLDKPHPPRYPQTLPTAKKIKIKIKIYWQS